MEVVVFLVKWIPKNLVSYIIGLFFRLFVPYPLNYPYLRILAFLFRVDLSEADKPLIMYHSFEELFTRKLKPGSRPLATGQEIISPVDGTLIHLHTIKEDTVGTMLNVKGVKYDLATLIYGTHPLPPAGGFKPKGFFTIYLAPHNYHRVHAPVKGKLVSILYHPGTLWPVNAPFVSRVPHLFSHNERVTFSISTKQGLFHVIMVGALNVGRISSPYFPTFISNSLLRQVNLSKMSLDIDVKEESLEQGDELGTFMLGSTVVVVWENKEIFENPETLPSLPHKIKMGEGMLSET